MILNKIFGGSTALLIGVCAVMFVTIKTKNKTIANYKYQEEKTSFMLELSNTKNIHDSLMYNDMIREVQSVLVQVNNKNKYLERENTNLRKGVRLDLLTIRKRWGKDDSTYTIAYKYLDK